MPTQHGDPLPELDDRVIFAFLLTLGAGLATSLGSLLGVMSRRFSPGLLTLALSFSAGVMLFISFVEIFPKARQILTSALGSSTGYLVAVLAFFGGMFAMAMVDRCLPVHGLPLQGMGPGESSSALMRTGLFSALAIAIHNVPEGLAISAPIYYATGSRRSAFLVSFLSGLAEPLGALAGYLFLGWLNNDLLLGLVFASVGGIMIYICLDELLPAAQRTGARHNLMIGGVTAGMAVMSVSLLLLA